MKIFVNRKDNKVRSYLKDFIKVGSKVIVVDGSYMLDSELKKVHGIDFHNGDSYELLEVIGVNTPVPTKPSIGIEDVLTVQNNCIIKGGDGRVYFCSGVNLEVFKDEQ